MEIWEYFEKGCATKKFENPWLIFNTPLMMPKVLLTSKQGSNKNLSMLVIIYCTK
jgi:hypothetical protein